MPRARTPAPPGQKHCHRCNQDRPEEDFARDASKSDGLRACCRACDALRLKAVYWTRARKQARRKRLAAAQRLKLERQHGRRWVAQQERLQAEEERAKREAEQHARREAAAAGFWVRLRARNGRSGSEQA